MDGQTAATKHAPALGESTTYNATIRNRGTTTYTGNVTGTFTLDGVVVRTETKTLTLAPGQTATFGYTRAWDNNPHPLDFAINVADARPTNNTLASDTMAVPFLTYLDQSFVEDFRDKWSPLHTNIQTDDLIDWLNDHMARFNAMFAAAGTQKRVGYGVLQVLDDTAADPTLGTQPYAVFPFRYRTATANDPRAVSAYYRSDDDIDYPKTVLADWNLTAATGLHFSAFAQNTNSPTFQEGSPWVRLTDINGNVYQYQYFTNGAATDLFSSNLNVWKTYNIPLTASPAIVTGWRRTQMTGTKFDFSHVTGVDFHADTWGAGFSVTYDNVGFDIRNDRENLAGRRFRLRQWRQHQ